MTREGYCWLNDHTHMRLFFFVFLVKPQSALPTATKTWAASRRALFALAATPPTMRSAAHPRPRALVRLATPSAARVQRPSCACKRSTSWRTCLARGKALMGEGNVRG